MLFPASAEPQWLQSEIFQALNNSDLHIDWLFNVNFRVVNNNDLHREWLFNVNFQAVNNNDLHREWFFNVNFSDLDWMDTKVTVASGRSNRNVFFLDMFLSNGAETWHDCYFIMIMSTCAFCVCVIGCLLVIVFSGLKLISKGNDASPATVNCIFLKYFFISVLYDGQF